LVVANVGACQVLIELDVLFVHLIHDFIEQAPLDFSRAAFSFL
jgi:hypothetical protein